MTQQNSHEVCERHGGAPAMSNCTSCGKPICRECTREFGYFCSRECLEQSRSHVSDADRQRRIRDSEDLDRAAMVGKWIGIAILAVVLAGLSFLIWKFFLDPAGKVSWTWEKSGGLYSLSVLSGNQDVVLVRTGDGIVTLDTRKGTAQGNVTLSTEEKGGAQVELLDEGFLLLMRNGLARYDADGTELFKRNTKWERLASCHSPDGSRGFMFMGSPRPQLSYAQLARRKEPLPPQQLVFSCLDLHSGKPQWSVKLAEGERLSQIVASAQVCYALHEKWTKTYESEIALRAYDPDSGKPRWEASVSRSPSWGPVIAGDLVLIEIDNTIHAFSSDGREAWSFETRPGISGKQILGDMLVITTVDGTQLLELSTGTCRWETAVSLTPESVAAEGDRLFAVGFATGEKSSADDEDGGPALPGSLEKNKDLLSDMGIDLNKLTAKERLVPSLLCLDAKSGNVLWQVPNVYGDLLTDGKRLVLVIDTARTSVLEMVTGGKGVLVLRQYDPKDGSMLYSRTSEIGLKGPRICGNRLVGVWHERTEQPSLMGGFSGGSTSSPKALGVIAFRLR